MWWVVWRQSLARHGQIQAHRLDLQPPVQRISRGWMLRHTPASHKRKSKRSFSEAAVKCIRNKAGIIENCRIALAEITDTVELERKAAGVRRMRNPRPGLIRKVCGGGNAYLGRSKRIRYGALAERYAKYKERLDATNMKSAGGIFIKARSRFSWMNCQNKGTGHREFSTGLERSR